MNNFTTVLLPNFVIYLLQSRLLYTTVIQFDVHNDNNEAPTIAYCQYWLVIVYSHIPVFSMLYTYLIRQRRIIGVYII